MNSKPKQKMRFKVDRRTWYRGKGAAGSKLLRESDGKMCCLGSVALQCGVKKEAIKNIAIPANIPKGKKLLPEWVVKNCSDAMICNDKPSISDDKREARLKKIFKEHGDIITFNH